MPGSSYDLKKKRARKKGNEGGTNAESSAHAHQLSTLKSVAEGSDNETDKGGWRSARAPDAIDAQVRGSRVNRWSRSTQRRLFQVHSTAQRVDVQCNLSACMERGWVVAMYRLCVDAVGLGTVKSSPVDVVDDTGENEDKEKKMKQKREEDGRQLRTRVAGAP